MTAGIMKFVNALLTNKKLKILKNVKILKMSDEEHSDREFYNREEQETAERKGSLDKVEASGDTGMKS